MWQRVYGFFNSTFLCRTAKRKHSLLFFFWQYGRLPRHQKSIQSDAFYITYLLHVGWLPRHPVIFFYFRFIFALLIFRCDSISRNGTYTGHSLTHLLTHLLTHSQSWIHLQGQGSRPFRQHVRKGIIAIIPSQPLWPWQLIWPLQPLRPLQT